MKNIFNKISIPYPVIQIASFITVSTIFILFLKQRAATGTKYDLHIGVYNTAYNVYSPCVLHRYTFCSAWVYMCVQALELKYDLQIQCKIYQYTPTKQCRYYKTKKSASLRYVATCFMHNIGGVSDRRWHDSLCM